MRIGRRRTVEPAATIAITTTTLDCAGSVAATGFGVRATVVGRAVVATTV